jgi:hypothetical protein
VAGSLVGGVPPASVMIGSMANGTLAADPDGIYAGVVRAITKTVQGWPKLQDLARQSDRKSLLEPLKLARNLGQPCTIFVHSRGAPPVRARCRPRDAAAPRARLGSQVVTVLPPAGVAAAAMVERLAAACAGGRADGLGSALPGHWALLRCLAQPSVVTVLPLLPLPLPLTRGRSPGAC